MFWIIIKSTIMFYTIMHNYNTQFEQNIHDLSIKPERFVWGDARWLASFYCLRTTWYRVSGQQWSYLEYFYFNNNKNVSVPCSFNALFKVKCYFTHSLPFHYHRQDGEIKFIYFNFLVKSHKEMIYDYWICVLIKGSFHFVKYTISHLNTY